MKNANEFDKEFARMPVRLLDFDNANGVLSLNGPDSLLNVASNKPIRPPERKRNGWFDLKAQKPDGTVILLHNALLLRAQQHHWGRDGITPYSSEIFPNSLIDDIRGLDKNLKIKRVMFRITGMRNFFYYRHTEPLLSFTGSEDQISALREMRYKDGSEGDLFDPEYVYVVHKYPPFFSFEIEDRTYEVSAGGRERFGGFHTLSYEIYPTATIFFSEAVDFESLIGRVWEWRRLFSQLAMQPLALEEMAVQGSADHASPIANVYLSNTAHKHWDTRGYYSLSPREQSYVDWGNRDKLKDCHKRWLELEPERKIFRASLDRVLEDLASRTDASDIVTLTAGIDSLNSLQQSDALPNDILTAMAEAAEEVSRNRENPLPLDRILGVMATLRRSSLAQKIKELGRQAAVNTQDVELIAKAATNVRNRAAHGGSTTAQTLPVISPAVHALAALCARFDLETSGFNNSTTIGKKTMASVWLNDNVRELKELAKFAD